jgi:hypothetical protein
MSFYNDEKGLSESTEHCTGSSASTLHDLSEYRVVSPDKDGIEQICSQGEDYHSISPPQPPFPGLKPTTSKVLTKITSHLTTRSLVDPGPPPDGGLKAWTQCAMAWIVLFSTWGYVNAFGAFQTHYTSTLGVSPSTISWVGSVQVWMLFMVSTFSGRALDAGFFLPTFLLGVIIQLIGILTMSFLIKYWQIFLT